MAARGGPLEAGRGRLTPREREIAGLAIALAFVALLFGQLVSRR
jgi:hypothetical protein